MKVEKVSLVSDVFRVVLCAVYIPVNNILFLFVEVFFYPRLCLFSFTHIFLSAIIINSLFVFCRYVYEVFVWCISTIKVKFSL